MASITAEPHAHAGHGQAHHHHPSLQHQFDTLEQQKESSTLGMWLFLVTEIMFFGGLFTAYVIYRNWYPEAFLLASNTLDVLWGGINTAVLICSSLTMALAIWAAQVNWRKGIVLFLIATIVLGGVFLGIKTVEYKDKFTHHHVPGPHFIFDVEHAGGVGEHAGGHIAEIAARDPLLERHTQIFFSLYFIMTGLHATHMVIGMIILGVLAWYAWKGTYDSAYHNPLEVTGLYWHFVDIVWIFLFPLLYLLGAHTT
ncbi:MAG TPA: cytochrome c oxidase subunit 3 family protein [Thermoanaerobaculia bacterium]|nr:cytochrome c oxidase subunit 3 family protein [Thermoanaerobaculia bacterium]